MLAMWQSNGAAITDIIAFSGKKKKNIHYLPPSVQANDPSVQTAFKQQAMNHAENRPTVA